MTAVLTREELKRAIERFTAGRLAIPSLAAWAFDQFYAAEEEELSYEAGFEETIAGVLDELMWSDSPPFGLTVDDAARLREYLDRAELGES